MDPSGKFAYVPNAYDSGNTVSQYTIDSVTGVLTPNTPSTATTGNQPTWVAVDPSGKSAFVVNRSDNSVSMFKIDASTGNLTPSGSIATGQEPFRIVVDPSGKFTYVVNESGSVSIYALGSDGLLTSAGTAQTGGVALSVAVTGTKQ